MERSNTSRRYLLIDQWPLGDRQAWDAAFQVGSILDGSGPAAHWAKATRQTNRQHYGCWLGFLLRQGSLNPDVSPETRVTIANVRSYVEYLKECMSPRTIVSCLVGLKVVMKAIAPQQDWRWLADICNALNRNARPQKDKAARMRPTEEIFAACIRELERLRSTSLKRRIERVAYRDTLMLAMIAARPLRLGNFTGLELGKSIFVRGQHWMLLIPGAEVKNRQTLEYALPLVLNQYLDVYLDRVRPSFLANARGSKGRSSNVDRQNLWLTFEGTPLCYHAIYGRIITVSKRLLGVGINPHLLRDCAATSLSMVSPAAARAAAPLLGHRQFATTERYYVRANQLEASRTLNCALTAIKSSCK